jgi:hypothetical protein
MSSKSKSGCPSPPDIKQKNEDITRIMNSLGASDKCKSAFSNAVDSSLQKGDAAIVIASFGGIGGGTASFSDSQNKMRENLNKSGCSDVFANVNQQMNSTQSILCEVSNYKNTTSLAGSANASIKIIQGKPTDAMLDVRSKVLSGLVVPTPPTEAIAFIDKDLYKTAYENYMRAMEIHKEEIDNIMGNVTIKNSYFKNTANVDMRVISSMSSIDTTSIAEHFKETAKNAAIQELKNKTGLGANSDSVKSLVANKINNKNQTISDSIKNHLQNVEISIASDSSVLIKFFGALTIDGVTFNQNAQGNLITQNIMTSASNLGKSVALDMLSDAASSTKSDKESGGQAKVLQQLLEGQVALSEANSAGAANMFKGVTGFLGMFAMIPIIIGVVILLFFPQISNVIAPGPLKYVLAAVLMYFVLAWFIGFWPFSKSEKSIFPYDGLAYVMTEHRGDPEGRGPYNWHVDHRWKIQ